MLEVFIILILLQIKHWYIDFVNQTDSEVAHKGVYLDWRGVQHSVKHGVATFLILFLFAPVGWAVFLAILDTVLHYHIDWLKMNKGNRDIRTKEFWNHLGMDQMAHQLGYLLIVGILIL
jgi:hypothetical protein